MTSMVGSAMLTQKSNCCPTIRGSAAPRVSLTRLSMKRQQRPVQCQAQCKTWAEDVAMKSVAAGGGAAAMLSLGAFSGPVLANEIDIMNEPTPGRNYVIDDAGVLSKTTRKTLNQELSQLETETGYRLEAVTVRKLEFENDAFAFGDKVIEKWYPTVEQGSKKGILLVVTSSKDGALTGGPGFLKAIGDGLIDSVVTDNIPILTEDEKYNESVTSSVNRVSAVLNGKADPGPPARLDTTRKRTYKTKAETSKSKPVTGTIVGVLLFIAVVVPMLQYWGYTSKE